MKTNSKLSILLILLIAMPVLLGSGCSRGNAPATATTLAATPTTLLSTTATVAATGGTKNFDIELKNFQFIPDTIEVKAGELVILNLVNSDSVGHTFTLDAFNRDVKLPAGTQASIQFLANKAGTFEFHCSIHPSMRGQLLVTQ